LKALTANTGCTTPLNSDFLEEAWTTHIFAIQISGVFACKHHQLPQALHDQNFGEDVVEEDVDSKIRYDRDHSDSST
jgi:hypothetical protein